MSDQKKTETKANEPQVDPNEELVEYTAPMLGMDKPRDVVCAVNGEMIRIKRGVPVKIKRKYFLALQNAAEQERAAWETMERCQRAGEGA